MSVTRCVCFHQRFAELLPRARAEGWTTLAEIAAATGCGSGCGGCRPYLAAMLVTGATRFRVAMDGGAPEPCPPDPWDAD
jgi:bacterioferritin-associated ferredoxin